MSSRYARWLIPRGNVLAPSGGIVATLVDKLRSERWIVDPSSPDLGKLRFEGPREERARRSGAYLVKTVENRFGSDAAAKIAASTEAMPTDLTGPWLDAPEREEARLVWPVRADDPSLLKYPLTQRPDGAAAYAIEIHRAPEFVYPAADTIEVISTECACGEDIAFEWDEDEVVPAFERSTGIFTECEECSRTFDPAKQSAEITNPFDDSAEDVFGGAAYRFAVKIDCGPRFVRDATLAVAPALLELLEAHFNRSFFEFGVLY